MEPPKEGIFPKAAAAAAPTVVRAAPAARRMSGALETAFSTAFREEEEQVEVMEW